MFIQNPSTLLRYAFSIVAVGLAAVARSLLGPMLGEGVPFITFFPVVVVCALFGGLGPGLLASLLSGLIAWYLFIPPYHSFAIPAWYEAARLFVFLLFSSLISFLAENLLRARRKTEEGEERERARREELRVTLASIGDAIIATDSHGNVTFMNGVAESLTGWGQAEAAGKPLTDVFRIFNEETRQPVENPVMKVVKSGQIIGLANHTLLIARDGTEIPIDDSAAPIKDKAGDLIGIVLVFRDITERRKAEEKRREAEARFRVAADSTAVMIWTAGTDKQRDFFNQGWLKFTGRTMAQEQGDGWTEGIHPDDFDLCLGTYINSFDTQQPFEMEYRLRRFDGEYRWILGKAIPRFAPDGTFSGYIGSCIDVTERKLAEAEREKLLARTEEARARAEEASRLKDEFLATVSHELRTPLNSILGWSRLLAKENLDPETTTRALETIERSARSQAKLIEDILDVSRIITGKLRLDVREIGLAPVIQSALDSIRPAAEAKNIRIQSTLDPSAGPILGDSARLQQVVWNLLSNAIKFTPRGGRVQVRLLRVNSHIEIIVSDTGQGIRQEFLPYVFDRFRQADGSSTREHGGLGLGLAIVRHLVELHGGTVRADSAGEGQGATFTVTLPLMVVHKTMYTEDRVHPRAEANENLPGDQLRSLEGIKVLVVDDDSDTLSLLAELLQRCGAETLTASSGAEALVKVKEWRPAVIVSDIGMPGEDGYAFIQKVRMLEVEQGGQTPAVALTAYARSEDRLKAFSAGYQMHLPKPVEPMELIVVLASLIGRSNGRSNKA